MMSPYLSACNLPLSTSKFCYQPCALPHSHYRGDILTRISCHNCPKMWASFRWVTQTSIAKVTQQNKFLGYLWVKVDRRLWYCGDWLWMWWMSPHSPPLSYRLSNQVKGTQYYMYVLQNTVQFEEWLNNVFQFCDNGEYISLLHQYLPLSVQLFAITLSIFQTQTTPLMSLTARELTYRPVQYTGCDVQAYNIGLAFLWSDPNQ